jgi:hypothetical protein
MSRVQVRDLDPPERLQPSGIQRDTFAQAAPPPIDNNLERLSSALGAFGDSVNAFHRASVIAERRDKAKKDKERLDGMDAEWNRWLSVTHSDEVLKAIREGRAPYQADPIFAAVIDNYWGKREAAEVGKKVKSALDADPSISLQPGFDPERYVLEHTAKHLEDGRLSRSKHAQKSFQAGIAGIKEEVIGWHQKNEGQRNQDAASQAAYDRFTEKLNAAAGAGYDVKSTNAFLQSVYQEFGPRMRGGSLDFQYNELDNIKLKVLEDMARNGNEQQARLAASLVNAERPDLLNPGKSLPSLAATARTKDRSQAIAQTAFNRIDEFEKVRETQKYVGLAVQSIRRMDGQTVLFGDKVKVQLPTTGKVVELKGEDIRKEAFRQVMAEEMIREGKPLSIARQAELAAKNGMEAPFASELNQEAAAALAPLSKDPQQRTQQLDRFIAAAGKYDEAANAAGGVDISGQLKGDAMKVYETYLTLTKKLGWSAQQAAEAVMRTYSETTSDDMTKRDLQRDDAIRSKVNTIDFNGWMPGGRAGSSWGTKLVNGGEISREVYGVALAIARVRGVTEKEAIDQAVENVKKRTTFVNGVAIFGVNGYNPTDVPYIEHVLKDRFKTHPKSMAAAGVTDPSQLSIAVDRSGAAVVVNTRSGDTVQILPEEIPKAGSDDAAGAFSYDAQPGERPTAMSYSPREHQALRARHAELMKDFEFKRSVERHETIMKSHGQPVPELINPPIPAPKTRTKMDGTPFEQGEKPLDKLMKEKVGPAVWEMMTDNPYVKKKE